MMVLISIVQRVKQWSIPDAQVARLRAACPDITFVHARSDEEALAGVVDADVAFTWKTTPDLLAAAARLRWVHSSAVAVGTIDLRALAARGVSVTNSRGIQSGPMADHVMGMTLMLARKLHECLRAQDACRWIQNDLAGAHAPWALAGRQMGIVGTGTIGAAIAPRAKAFGMRVIGLRRRAEGETPAGFDAIVGPDQLDALVGESDVLVLAAPLTPETRGLIGARELALLRPGALLVNVGRGQLVDDAALVAALEAGHLGGAGLDVFAHEPLDPASPYWRLPNVIVSPHVSGLRVAHWDAVVDLCADHLRRFRRGEPLRNPVDCSAGY